MLKFDKLISDSIHKSTNTGGGLEYLIVLFAMSFNNELTTFYYSLLLLYTSWSLKIFFLCLISPLFGLLITIMLKRKISRPRPTLYIPRCKALIFDLRGREKNHSMPSGDSAQAAIFWTIVWNLGVLPVWASVLLTVCTMFSRVYYMCHYFLDTFFGVLIGLISVYLTKNLVDTIAFILV